MTTVEGPSRSRRAFLAGVTLAAAGMLATPAVAREPDPDEAVGLVRDTTQRLLTAVAARGDAIRTNPGEALDLVREYIEPHVDLERSSRWVLGKHWRRATAEQRTRFIAEFRTLLLRTYALAVAENPRVDIEYLPARRTRRKNETIVRTRVPQSGAPPISVHYRMHNGTAGWKLFDVAIEGVSLVTTYRTSFTQRVKLRGLDGLIEDLQAKNRSASDA